MTAHWNISAPPAHPGHGVPNYVHPHTVSSHSYMGGAGGPGMGMPPGMTPPHHVSGGHIGGGVHVTGGGNSKNKHSNLGQYGVSSAVHVCLYVCHAPFQPRAVRGQFSSTCIIRTVVRISRNGPDA